MWTNTSNKPGQAPVRGLTESTVCFATQLDIGGKGYSGIVGKEHLQELVAIEADSLEAFKRRLDHRSLKEKMTKKPTTA